MTWLKSNSKPQRGFGKYSKIRLLNWSLIVLKVVYKSDLYVIIFLNEEKALLRAMRFEISVKTQKSVWFWINTRM